MLDLEALNNAQRKAVMHGEGPLLVLAGPGSGKTFTITQRILYLIEVLQVPPEEILVITFTKEAALSMQRRFQEQSNRIYPVNFGTFHSVFYQILRRSGASKGCKLLGESQKKNLILPILRQCNIAMQKKQHNSLQEYAKNYEEFLAAISYYKNTGDKQQAELKLSAEKRSLFCEIFESYERARKQQGAIDFDDMVYECARLLEQNQQIREYWGSRFSHILMDEFQDINPMQYRVIRQLAASPYNLFAVGDDDQAIYGFRGSNPACMQHFLKDYSAERILLNINYRSYPAIVAASLKVIEENKGRFFKELKSCEEKAAEEEVVSLRSFTDSEEQYTYLTNLLVDRGENATCAVLFRTNMRLQSFAARLNRLGIGYDMKEKAVSIYEHFIVKDIMAYLRIAAGEQNRELYLQILNKPARGLSREALVRTAVADREDSYDAKQITVTNEMTKEMYSYYQRQRRMGIMDEFHIQKAEKSLAVLEKQLAYMQGTSIYPGIQYICKVMGYERYLETECRKRSNGAACFEEWTQILEWLKEEAKGYDCLADWMEAQKAYETKMSDKTGNDKETAKKVQLMTVHASKGLEFDKVYIPDCNEKNFPHGSMPDRESIEEERRIFYVAMTRAKKSLELLYLTGTKERPRLPSRFLNTLIPQPARQTHSCQDIHQKRQLPFHTPHHPQ